MITNDGKDLADVREMDELFRRADFAAESPGLGGRLWGKIRAKLASQNKCMFAPERELSEDELIELAAAGAPERQAAGPLKNVLRQSERGRP